MAISEEILERRFKEDVQRLGGKYIRAVQERVKGVKVWFIIYDCAQGHRNKQTSGSLKLFIQKDRLCGKGGCRLDVRTIPSEIPDQDIRDEVISKSNTVDILNKDFPIKSRTRIKYCCKKCGDKGSVKLGSIQLKSNLEVRCKKCQGYLKLALMREKLIKYDNKSVDQKARSLDLGEYTIKETLYDGYKTKFILACKTCKTEKTRNIDTLTLRPPKPCFICLNSKRKQVKIDRVRDRYNKKLAKYGATFVSKEKDIITYKCSSNHQNTIKLERLHRKNQKLPCRQCRQLEVEGWLTRFKHLTFKPFTYSSIEQELDYFCNTCGKISSSKIRHLKNYKDNFCKNCYIESRGWSKTKWIQQAQRSSRFDSYKVYVIELNSKEESFAKVGMTTQTVNQRFTSLTEYDHKPILIIQSKDVLDERLARTIFDLENSVRKILEPYKPQTYFEGHTECVTLNSVNNIMSEQGILSFVKSRLPDTDIDIEYENGAKIINLRSTK